MNEQGLRADIADRTTVALLRRRDRAREAHDLNSALVVDNQLEDFGLPADDRITCCTCLSGSAHAHHPVTGGRFTVENEQTTANANDTVSA